MALAFVTLHALGSSSLDCPVQRHRNLLHMFRPSAHDQRKPIAACLALGTGVAVESLDFLRRRRRLQHLPSRGLSRHLRWCKPKRDCNENVLSTAGSQQLKFVLKEVLGKGVGAVASQRILKGECILSEAPAVELPASAEFSEAALTWLEDPECNPQLEETVQALLQKCDDADRTRFWELSDCHSGQSSSRSAAGVALTNAIRFGPARGVFPITSRFNHSCRPNINGAWALIAGVIGGPQKATGVGLWHALRDIEEGEELCFMYTQSFEVASERQSFLQNFFKFRCQCAVCSLPGDQLARSDVRRRELSSLHDNLRETAFAPDIEGMGETAQQLGGEICQLLDDEFDGNCALKGNVHFTCFQLAMESDDIDLAQTMARHAWECAMISHGAHSQRAKRLKGYASDPESFLDDEDDALWDDFGQTAF